MEIKVLGSTCCNTGDKLAATVKEVLSEKGLTASVQTITDLQELLALGIMRTPGLVIDGKVVAAGRSPSKDELRTLLGA